MRTHETSKGKIPSANRPKYGNVLKVVVDYKIINILSIFCYQSSTFTTLPEKDNDAITLWSDEEGSTGRFLIQFTQKEVLAGIENVFEDLKQYVRSVGEWSVTHTELDRCEVEDCFSTFLMKPLLK